MSANSSNCSTSSEITDNTIVFYSTDNGPHYNTWPDAAATPFRGEKNTNWEGGWRVPGSIVRWPGKIKEGSVVNGIVHHMDWLPTFMAASPVIRTSRSKLAQGRLRRPMAAPTRCISTATTSFPF